MKKSILTFSKKNPKIEKNFFFKRIIAKKQDFGKNPENKCIIAS